MATTWPMSTKQAGLITRLATERTLTPAIIAELDQTRAAWEAGYPVSSKSASRLIETLFGRPRKPAAEGEFAQPGYYVEAGGDFIVVVENKAKTATYAKRLVIGTKSNGAEKPSWEYAPGVGKTLAGLTPMTLQQAAAFGHAHGYCLICFRQLTDPKSVEAGIGPICSKKF